MAAQVILSRFSLEASRLIGVSIATANCMKVAEDVFEFDGERICAFRSQDVTIDREKLIEACRVCPVDALIVIDERGNHIVP